jgi:hypothetical protein
MLPLSRKGLVAPDQGRGHAAPDEEEPCAEKEKSRISLGFREKKTTKYLLLFDQGCLLRRKVSSNYVVL